MILRRNKKLEILAIVVACVSIFLPIIQSGSEGKSFLLLRYLDEFIALGGVFYIITYYDRLNKNVHYIFLLLSGLTVVGLIGTFINQLQTGTFPVLLDIFAFWKVFLAFILGDGIIGGLSESSKKHIIKVVNYVLVPWMIVAFFLAIINVFADIGMSDESRFGRRCFAFFYPKSSTFSNLFYIFMLFITLNYAYNKNIKHLMILAMALAVWFLTLRSRAVLFVFIFIGMYYWIVYRGKKLKYKLTAAILVLIFSLFVIGEKIENTYSNDAAPRTLLLTYGIKTMLTYMPIGAGYGTYGTDVACTYYSKLYRMYGFEYAYGLQPNDTRYAHDTYWPAVMGEMGLIGIFIMVGVLFFWARIIMSYSKSYTKYMLCIFLITTQIMASLPTSVFFQNNTAFLFLLLPLLKDSRKPLFIKLRR